MTRLPKLPRPVVVAVTVLIAVVWAVNVVIGFVVPERHDPAINGLFALVVGAIYALGGDRNARGGADE